MKPLKLEVVGIFPPNSKQILRNKRKRKGKDKESYILIVNIIFNIKCWWIVFDDEIATFRNKNDRTIYYVKKIKIKKALCVVKKI